MSILWRSWITFTAIIATVLIVLALLSSFQHNALYSDLIRQRLSVVAQTTADSFQPVVNLGLPISMVRNARDVLARAQQTDPRITAIHAFNPTGIIVQTTDPDEPGEVPDEVRLAQSLADSSQWSVETDTELYSGISMLNAAGTTVANIVVVYPKEEFVARTAAVVKHIATITFGLLIIFSAAAYVLLRLRLSGAIHGLARLDLLSSTIRHDRGGGGKTPPMTEEEAANLGFLRADIEALEDHLHRATKSYDAAISSLGITDEAIDDSGPIHDDNGDGQAVVVTSAPETSLARSIARKLVPWAGLLIIGSALTLGILTIRTVNRSIEPEIANRTTLMGTVINGNIQRAVSAGVPLGKLVGAERYFGSFLQEFPEVAYIGVATGRIILEAGKRQDDIYGPRRSSKHVVAYPIESGGEQIGYIIIDVDTGYIAKEFENVLLDLAVVALVAILLAFEVLVVMMSVSLTAPFNRLQHLVTLQAAGDFSKRIEARGKHAVDVIGARLSERAEMLHRAFARAWAKTTPGVDDDSSRSLNDIKSRFGLSTHRPNLMLFSYLNDIRLPLFLFAAADALPLAFFPLFTRAADNPLSWLDLGVVISLPLAGYLIAIMAGSPYARPLADRFGHRKLILLAVVPTIAAHVGLYLSTNVIEIVLFRTVAGFGYAIVTLACQDYVLDVVPKEQRARSLGIYAGVLFAGIFCGTAMGGVLADRLGQDTVFLVSAGLVLVSALLVYRLLPSRRLPQAAGAGSTGGMSASIWAPLRSHRFSALVFGIAIPAQVLMQAFISYLVALYLHELGASVADTGRTLMVFFLMIALMGPTTARVTDGRFDPALVTVLGAILSGVSLLMGAVWGTQLGILIAVWGAGIGHGMIRGPQVSIAMTIAETDLARLGSNAVLGSLRTLERGGSIIGLVLIALLSSTIGYPAAIGVVGVWALAGAAAFTVSLAMSGDLRGMAHRTTMKHARKIGVLLVVMAALFWPASHGYAQAKKEFTIYMVFWRGCEEACQGFKEYIAESGIDAELVMRNANRDKGKLSGYVEEARALNADLVVTWGTSVTRGIAGTLSDQGNPRFINDIPLVFMVVADPIGSKVIVSYEKTGRDNVTGTRNRVPESVNINTIRSYFPEFKRLGILYNTNENNSVVKVKEIERLAEEMNFELVALELELGADGKPKPESIPVRMAELEAAGVDFIYLGSSSFLDVQRDLFTRSAVDHGIPVLSPYERLVRDSHALLSIAARYQDVGKIAGRQVKSILIDGKKPGDLPVLSVDQYAYVVNMTTAKKLNMFPSVEILQIAETVE